MHSECPYIGGAEGIVGITIEDADALHYQHGFEIVDLIDICEVRCVADGDEGHGHDQRQHQSE